MTLTAEQMLGNFQDTYLLFSQNPACWTKGVLARDADGKEVQMDDPAAVSYCLRGGFGVVLQLNGHKDWKPFSSNETQLAEFMAKTLNISGVGEWNNRCDDLETMLEGLAQTIVATLRQVRRELAVLASGH